MSGHKIPDAPDGRHIDLAENALRHFGGSPDRGTAAHLLTMWTGKWMLTDSDQVELLARFDRTARPAVTR